MIQTVGQMRLLAWSNGGAWAPAPSNAYTPWVDQYQGYRPPAYQPAYLPPVSPPPVPPPPPPPLPVALPPLPATLPPMPPVLPPAPPVLAPTLPVPGYQPVQPPQRTGPVTGTTVKDGHRLPHTSGRATTFWNGHYTYKGKRDRENMSIGAWGDQNRPTEYFCALLVSEKWWHNQKILVTNPKTGKQVVVLLQDKGPGAGTGNAIDLSPVAKEALGVNFMDNPNVKIAFAPEDMPVGPVA